MNHLTFQSNTSHITLQKLVNGVFESHLAEAIQKKSKFEILIPTELLPLEMAIYKIKPSIKPTKMIHAKTCSGSDEANNTDLLDSCKKNFN